MTNELEKRIEKIVSRIKKNKRLDETIFIYVENISRDSMVPTELTLKLAKHNYVNLSDKEIEEKLVPKVVSLHRKIKEYKKKVREGARLRMKIQEKEYSKKLRK